MLHFSVCWPNGFKEIVLREANFEPLRFFAPYPAFCFYLWGFGGLTSDDPPEWKRPKLLQSRRLGHWLERPLKRSHGRTGRTKVFTSADETAQKNRHQTNFMGQNIKKYKKHGSEKDFLPQPNKQRRTTRRTTSVGLRLLRQSKTARRAFCGVRKGALALALGVFT